MSATPDRTTIKAAIEQLTTQLQTNLVADPPTASQPFRRVAVGVANPDAYPRPFLILQLVRTRPVGTVDNDKLVEISVALRIVTDISATDPHQALLDKIGALDDYLDSILDTGIEEGVEGFDNRSWTFDYPSATAGARTASASATGTLVVKVEREQNREPAA